MAQEPAKVPFTKSEIKYSPAYEHYGTLYPVLDYKDGAFHKIIVSLRKAIAPINPFAHQQVPTSHRIALAERHGDGWFVPDSYPNSIVFETGYPSHYDPLKDTKRPVGSSFKYWYPLNYTVPGYHGIEYPRACYRQIQLYKRCVNINGKELCKEEGDNILNICQTFALDMMREKKIREAKKLAIDNLQYQEVMKVGDYNKGRTVANVANKTWADGNSDKLRPDTMWADDRYVDITQKDINEAKARIAQRKAAKAHHDADHHAHQSEVHGHADAHHNEASHHYDWVHVQLSHNPDDKPLYS